jgi:hypothetical protein
MATNAGQSMAGALSDGTKERLFNYAVWLVVLWASALNLLNHHSYPLVSAEVGLLLAGLAVVAVLMGTLRLVAGTRIGFLFSGLFAAIAIDLNTAILVEHFYLLWAGLTVVAWYFEKALLKITLAAFASVFLFQFVALTTGIGANIPADNEARNRQAETGRATTRPAIIHLVLDSYLGLEGMAIGSPEHRALYAEQTAFYAERGFQTYPRAYSRHVKTMNSLPHLFSYGTAPLATTSRNLQYLAPKELRYFRDLDARGYRTQAMLARYVDLCVAQKMVRCRNFDRSALSSMRGTDIAAGDRAVVLAFTLLHLSDRPSRVAETIQHGINEIFGAEGRLPYNRQKLLPLSALQQFDAFTTDLATLRPGEVRLAHLLAPHDPYMMTPTCRVKPAAQWLDEHGPGTVRSRERGYADQVRCLTSRIDMMLQALGRTPAGRDAIVILHGDHGSRITPVVPFLNGPTLSDREVLLSHSTFFAIRVPGERAAVVPGTYALDELMGDFAARDFASAPRPVERPARYLLMDFDWIPRRWENLPRFQP